MATVNFEKNKKEALKNLISDKTDNRRHIYKIINTNINILTKFLYATIPSYFKAWELLFNYTCIDIY